MFSVDFAAASSGSSNQRKQEAEARMKQDEVILKRIVYCVSAFVLSLSLALAITAIVEANKYGDDPCIRSLDGTHVKYGTWLAVYGWTQVACVGGIVVLHLLLCKSMDIFMLSLTIWGGINGFFQLAWYIFGALELFQGVKPNCPDTYADELWQFGLALFIIQTVSLACGCVCGLKHQRS